MAQDMEVVPANERKTIFVVGLGMVGIGKSIQSGRSKWLVGAFRTLLLVTSRIVSFMSFTDSSERRCAEQRLTWVQ